MYAEALNTYQVIVKNKMFSNAGDKSLKSCIVVACPCNFVIQIHLSIGLCKLTLFSARATASQHGEHLL